MDEYLGTHDAAAELGMSRRWVEARVADGSLPAWAWDVGRRPVWRIRRVDLAAFAARHRHLAAGRPSNPEGDGEGDR
jgi:excisionase family DNA binding protein